MQLLHLVGTTSSTWHIVSLFSLKLTLVWKSYVHCTLEISAPWLKTCKAHLLLSLLIFFPLFLFPSYPFPSALRVISCEVSEVCLTVLPSPLWIQTLVAFRNAPSVITSCGAQPVPQQRDGRRPKWPFQSQWLQYQTKRMPQEQEQEERACQGRKQG